VVRLPPVSWRYVAFSALTMFGIATFGLLGYHLTTLGLLDAAVVYAVAPPLALATSVTLTVAGALVWGAALGVQESTHAGGDRRSGAGRTAGQRQPASSPPPTGPAWAGGGAVLGLLYQTSYAAIVGFVAVTQVAALVTLATVRRPRR